MPVIFNTSTSHRVFMLDKDAEFMLKAMKTSGNIPGALFPEAIADAFESLKNQVKQESDKEGLEQSSISDSDHVGVSIKALPLINLMRSAIVQKEKLMWDKE